MTRAKPLRVIVADDSLTLRKSLLRALTHSGDIEVIAEARDGEELVSLCLQHRPDVITLDVVMPRLDGVRATEEIMARAPTPILVVSAAENRGDQFNTLQALAAGAVDVLEKPRSPAGFERFAEQLRRAVRLVARIPVITHPRARLPRPATPTVAHGEPQDDWRGPLSMLALGASTGGPQVVAEILRDLPASLPFPVLVVLHIGPSFGLGLAAWFDGLTKLMVQQAKSGQPYLPGHVYVCPPDHHMVVRAERIWLTQEPERHSCRPSVDVLFESIAENIGPRAAGCLLTGIGRDGAGGLLAMRRAGALTIAQDEESCTVYGMPREAIELGAARRVANPGEIVAQVRALAAQNASWS
jgi:two-component system chemotaxis response regulator CheB